MLACADTNSAGMRMMRGMSAGLPMGLRPMPAVGSDSEDDDDDDPMGASMAYVPEGAEEADLVARAQSESMDLATEGKARYTSSLRPDTPGAQGRRH